MQYYVANRINRGGRSSSDRPHHDLVLDAWHDVKAVEEDGGWKTCCARRAVDGIMVIQDGDFEISMCSVDLQWPTIFTDQIHLSAINSVDEDFRWPHSSSDVHCDLDAGSASVLHAHSRESRVWHDSKWGCRRCCFHSDTVAGVRCAIRGARQTDSSRLQEAHVVPDRGS